MVRAALLLRCLRLGSGTLMAGLLLLLTACAVPQRDASGPPEVTTTKAVAAEFFDCGGALERDVWRLWDAQGRAYLRAHQIEARLLRQGDTYALYDTQIIFHNLEAMAQRCGRVDRLVQLADDLLPLFNALQPLPGQPGELAWICSGGSVCNERNRLANTEVMLVSVQGLGLLSALARDLAVSDDPQAREHPLIARTVQASLAHLRRWGGSAQVEKWRQTAKARPQDVRPNSSALFFTDKHLWQITIYANLAGVAAVQPQWFEAAAPGSLVHQGLSAAIKALLHFFQRRLALEDVDDPRLGRVQLADLDAGFWRLYGQSNRFAGYSGSTPPAVCVRLDEDRAPVAEHGAGQESGQARPVAQGSATRPMRAELRIDPTEVPMVSDLGWDISHARRLVHALNALEVNRRTMADWWNLPARDLPSPDLAQAFAARLLARVWNGDTQAPLFTNYLSGANGWYRVAYDNGTGRCYAGYPPFGLSASFATGGYAQWEAYFPQIGELARTLYQRTKSMEAADQTFVERYYRGLSYAESSGSRMTRQIMFWPSLVH